MQSSYRQQLMKYVWVLGWLVRDFVWRYRWRAALLTAMRFGGMAIQLSTFGLLAKYARMLETNETIALPWGESVVARESLALLWIIGGASLVAMIAGSALILYSSRRMEQLCAEYETYCGQRVLRIAGMSTRLDRPTAIDGDDEQFILRLAKPYSRFLRRVTKTMLTSLLPSLVVVAAVLPVLFMLNAWLTALVVVLAAFSLTAHYKLNVGAAQSSLTIERTARESLLEFRNVLGQIRENIAPLDDASIQRPFVTRSLRQNLNAYFTRVTATNESQFISDCLTAVILVAVLVTLGGSILRDGEGWASLLVYLLALRYSMSQLKGALTGFSVIARFFHQARAYFLFITSEHDAIAAVDDVQLDSLSIRCNSHQPLPGSRDQVTLHGGDRVAVLGPFLPTRFQVRALYGVLLGESADTIRAAMARTILVADENTLSKLSMATPLPATTTANPRHNGAATDTSCATDRLSLAVLSEKVARRLQERDPAEGRERGNGAASMSHCLLVTLVSRVSILEQLLVDLIVVTDGECVSWIGPPEQFQAISGLLEPVNTARAAIGHDDIDDEEQSPAFDDAM